LSFIIPHTLLSNDSFEKLRRLLLAKVQLREVIDIGPGVFESASNETMVFVATNLPATDDTRARVFTTKADSFPSPIKDFRIQQKDWLQNPKATWLVNVSDSELAIVGKMDRAGATLGSFCTINQGLRTGDNKKYLSTQPASGKWKPAVGGKDVGRYEPLPEGLYVYYDPVALDAPRKKEIFESSEKLVVQEIRNITLPRRIVATYDNRQFYCLQSTNVVNLRPGMNRYALKYLLAILNSNAVNFFFRQRFPGNNHIPSNQLAQIPIPASERAEHDAIVKLVERILAAKRAAPDADTTAWEREIDERVYRLYGLTPDEIKIVEDRVPGPASNVAEGKSA